MMPTQPARVRFAPSPTGRLHIGGARTALYDFLYARKTGGQFILRIEDTDRKRYDPEAEQEFYETLRWLGLDWDEGPDIGGPFGPYRQSERMEIYQEYILRLIDAGSAYYCFCSAERLQQVRELQQKRKEPPHYDGHCRTIPPDEAKQRVAAGEPSVVRFKVPRPGRTTAVDLLRGEIAVENSSIDDYILLKSTGMPVYHFAAILDDHLMGITHVLRGSEWLPTFPLHVLIYEAFGWEQPVWVHLSVLLNPSGKGKLSKRHANAEKSGSRAVFALDLREMGYLPEAVLNWIGLMGWSYDDHQEFFPMDEFISKFSLEKLNPSPAAVNFSKLDHFNGLHIRALSTDELTNRLVPFFEQAGLPAEREMISEITPLVQERIRTLDEAVEMARFFFKEEIPVDREDLIGKNLSTDESAHALEQAAAVIESLNSLEQAPFEQALRDLADDLDLKAGQLFGMLRMAVTGQRVSPPLIESMTIVGREKVLDRIQKATTILRQSG
ncbi:MAG: glutamate--tRNA ligase [Anaerolineales bacterium]|nr:glutamate--tRNA ligase [Anaerolineales bacterium]